MKNDIKKNLPIISTYIYHKISTYSFIEMVEKYLALTFLFKKKLTR